MKRALFALPVLLALFVATGGGAGEAAGKVRITWLGQSFFLIKASKGTLAIDPHAMEEYGRFLGIKADGVLMSHLHNDHTQKEVIENYKDKNFKVFSGLIGKGFTGKWNKIDEQFKGFHIRSVPTYHDDMEGMKSGKNTVFVIEVDGWRIVHLGDLGHLLSEQQIKQIGPVDVLMIPCGGVYTLNGSEAKKVMEQLKPREYVFPMHYGNIRVDALLTVDEFLDDNPAPAIAVSRDDALLINKDRKENMRFLRMWGAKSDNTIVLDKDKDRPRPLVTVLHWFPQVGKKKKAEK